MLRMNENDANDEDGVEIYRPVPQDDAQAAPAAASDSTTPVPPPTPAYADDFDDPRTEQAPAATPAAERSTPSRARRYVGFGVAAVVLLGVGAGGGALTTLRLEAGQQPTAAVGSHGFGQSNGSGSGSSGSSGSGSSGFGFGSGSGSGSGSSGNGSGSSGSQGGFGFGFGGSNGFSGSDGSSGAAGPTATAKQQTGVVTIVSELGYESGEAAGTGIVLTSSGEILTNNHVVEGSTALKVTLGSTGRTYTASVVGTDPGDDVAVLQLKGASGLTPAPLASSAASVGDSVTAVGNAGGTGTLTTASGGVTALGQSITTEAEGSAASESLKGLIQTDAAIQAGDSGGPLENGSGEVVGIDTAASSGTSQVTGFAIPIATAESIAHRILAGDTSGGITLGTPAFLGIELAPDENGDGALVQDVVDGTPAASAGIVAGDTITAVDGKAVSSASDLTTALHAHKAGDSVSLTVTDQTGASGTVQATLTTGPAN